MQNNVDHVWMWNAARQERFRLSYDQTCWVYEYSGLRVPVEASDDGPSSLSDVTELPRAQNHYPLINTEGSEENCTWVSVAALLANGDRMTTEMLYARLKEKNIKVPKGSMSQTSLLKAARTLGNVTDKEIDGSYTELSENGVPQRQSFAVGVLIPGETDPLAHRIVGYYDGDWYRFTDWQEAPLPGQKGRCIGDDVTKKVIGEGKVRGWHITYVFWFTSIFGQTESML
ncbi:hypothetical protein J4E91_009170 [Alternaria rosae]|nr:hypothetical protein J4E91_009170 [Alternaria rosae]